MSSNAEEWTIGRLLTWTTDFLKRHGSQSPRLDAEVLLAHARGCRRIDLYTAFHEVVDETVRGAFREQVRERSQGKPVAYLVGQREFYSLTFHVTPDVLIPRPETELVVVALLDRAPSINASPIGVADVGTGSGVLAVCAARHLPAARVTAIDISEAALQVAMQNAELHQLQEKIHFVRGDLFENVAAEQRFHFVLSNPPYVSESEFESLSSDVKNYEPRVALVSGETGMEAIERLVAQAQERLEPGGWLIFEISPMIAGRVRQLLESQPLLSDVRIERDLAGQERVAIARRASAE